MAETKTAHGSVDVYPVGVLKDLQGIVRALKTGEHRRKALPHALTRLRSTLRYMVQQGRAGEWRAVKNSLNGYLAEPLWETGQGPWFHRAGSGWTKARALRSLDRHVAGANPNLRAAP